MKFLFGILIICAGILASAAGKPIKESSTISSIYDLEALFVDQQNALLPISPPSEEIYLHLHKQVLPVDWKKFPKEFVEQTYGEMDENGYPIFFVTIYEDPTTRETVFLNSYGFEIYRLEAELGYDPYAWQKKRFNVYDISELSEWTSWIFDPAHIAVDFALIPENLYSDYEATQEEIAEQLLLQKTASVESASLMMSLPPVITSIQLAIERTANGTIEVEIGWPTGFTDRLEIYTATDLVMGDWQLALTNINTDNSSSFVWEDANTNLKQRLYAAGNMDIDSDGDGIPDAREIFIYKTDPALADTDGDGVNDGNEVANNTDPLQADSDGDGLHDGIEDALALSIQENGSGGVLIIVPGTGWYHAIDPDQELVYLGDE